MAWSRRLQPQQEPAVSAQPAPSRIAQPPAKTKAQRTTNIREPRPAKAAPARVAKQAPPPRLEAPPAVAADPQPVSREQARSAPDDKTDSSPASNPAIGSEAGSKREQVTAVPSGEDATTATTTPVPETGTDSKTEPSAPSANAPSTDIPPAEFNTAALAPPKNADGLIAILLVRPEIKSVSDLANKVVAIDDSPSDYSIAGVKRAIVAAGAGEVRMSEDQKMALIRVLDGDVPAGVVAVLSPKAAEAWSGGFAKFNVLRVSLSSSSEKAKRE
ncbi:hypothetical protein JQ628_20875 [Bradyrhizobium lablabi]|uniref:hypothetical protein n=1 Tax=Bradyrhizobium lablabi TaxID=722472 RepID=UPI001BA90AD9|nr:hypothetical protein [Bradyrhizobium lablabi]MBR1123995.1 hypothetical protein [Bradyrhizobium lablabi]